MENEITITSDTTIALPTMSDKREREEFIKLDKSVIQGITNLRNNVFLIARNIFLMSQMYSFRTSKGEANDTFKDLCESRYHIHKKNLYNYINVGSMVTEVLDDKGRKCGWQALTDAQGRVYDFSKCVSLYNKAEKKEIKAIEETAKSVVDASMSTKKIDELLSADGKESREAHHNNGETKGETKNETKGETKNETKREPSRETTPETKDGLTEEQKIAYRKQAWMRVTTPDGTKYFVPVNVLKRWNEVAEILEIKGADEPKTETK